MIQTVRFFHCAALKTGHEFNRYFTNLDEPMQIWIRAFFYGLLLIIAVVAFLNSSMSELSESDWRNVFFSTISLIFAIVMFDGSLYFYEWKKNERSKKRLKLALRPIFIKMHELWFSMAYHSMSRIMGDNRNVFSEEYKIEICKYLDLESDAPVLGSMSWREYLFSNFEFFGKELHQINILALSIGWEELEDSLSEYLNSGFNQNVLAYLYSVRSIPGGLELHPYLSVFGHWGNGCIDDYLKILKKIDQILVLENFDFYQEERLVRIHKANEFGKCRASGALVRNL